MRLYTVHLKSASGAADGEAVFVKQGFCWPALFFRWLWALATGLWIEAIALLGIEIVLSLVVGLIGLDPVSAFAILVGWFVILGTVGNDLRRWNLARRGYREVATVGERNRDDAERRFFEGYAMAAEGGAEVRA